MNAHFHIAFFLVSAVTGQPVGQGTYEMETYQTEEVCTAAMKSDALQLVFKDIQGRMQMQLHMPLRIAVGCTDKSADQVGDGTDI